MSQLVPSKSETGIIDKKTCEKTDKNQHYLKEKVTSKTLVTFTYPLCALWHIGPFQKA